MEKNIEKGIKKDIEKKSDKINFGLTGNKLKLVAVICMIIDHVGYFCVSKMSHEMYVICRCIGRIAMPIFVFLLVEGFFHTKNFKKYILRMFSVAIITQIIIFSLNYINITYFLGNIATLRNLNILFSFTFILLILRLIEKRVVYENICIKVRNVKVLDIILRVSGIIVVLSIYFVLELDYSIYLVLIAIIMYYLKKYENSISKSLRYFLLILTLGIVSIIAIKNIIGVFAILSLIFISKYNGKRGKKSKLISTTYYLVFPFQYFIIYLSAIVLI